MNNSHLVPDQNTAPRNLEPRTIHYNGAKSSKLTAAGLFLLLLVFLFVFFNPSMLFGKDVCASMDGVQVCIQMKGPCDLYHLIPKEKSKIKMDMFLVSIVNNSNHKVKVIPENFYGFTKEGYMVAMDVPFYESIELKTKLQKKDLEPQERLKGFLFFPTSFGLIRTLVYGGEPFLEILLY